ncbi:MAG: efflux RND transporter permease subunit [Alistipes sp.]|uniref:efflux RND transporter permease subunit n=1 Tax=Alistipes sp. TaxID=1872444 RepID=UPI0025C50FF2|nr:efflux RND transporter permease subunit [Alistipes sp.]MCD8276309.1 efflux RND transporter permease subunit [Alistipes sp.]
MNLRFFIDRPIFSIVISVTIVLLGVISLTGLPVEQYPDIAPPTVQVTTSYPGANAETVQKAVIVPLEEAINGVENMSYIHSEASNTGEVTVNVYFNQGVDPDMAAVNVQNRVSKASGLLPAEVTKIGVQTLKQQKSLLKVVALYSPDDSYDLQFINNYMKINVEPRVKRISGVGEFNVLASNYSMRIWLKPDIMAQYKLIPSDVTNALAKQNLESATGSFGENHENAYEYTIKYKGRLSTPEEFNNIVIRSLPGGDMLRLEDVARVEMGDEAYTYRALTDGHAGCIGEAYQSAGSNATEVVQNIDVLLEELSEDLPEGLAFADLLSVKDFLFASIENVLWTLIEAIILVILVVYVFLQDIRSTLIPTVSIVVSLVGTFAFLAIAGFSVNLLTLFALVLAIGTVVDNAIVVVEAVQARFDVGYKSSYMATNDAMSGITSAIITSTLVFMAVFIPVSMMGGTSGVFYTQFGITMAVAVGLSAINALTLSPALCAMLLQPYLDEEGNMRQNFAARFRMAFNAAFSVIIQRYIKGVIYFIRHRYLVWGTLAATVVLLVILMRSTKTGLVPDEDTGAVMVSITTKPGTSLHATTKILSLIEKEIQQMPQVEHYATVGGYSFSGSGASAGMIILSLRDWSERKGREDDVQSVIGHINALSAKIPDAQIFAAAPPMITGYGMVNGFELHVQDKTGRTITELDKATRDFIAALEQRPEIGTAYSSFSSGYPQYTLDIDAAKCERSGISPSEVLETISGYYGGQYVSNFNRFSKLYRVMIQAEPDSRVTPESLNHLFVRTGDGEMASIGQFARVTKTYGPQSLNRFNLYGSIAVNGAASEGYSSGDAIRAIEEATTDVLPKGYTYEFGGITREESGSSSNTVVIFGICFVLVYLILSALYESFLIPFAVVLALPFGLAGSFLFAKMMGLENNIYMQTGLIMLIGLLAKTAILITEYAVKRRQAGMSLTQAAVGAAKVRLRPILMTALTMVFGLLPLMVSTGVGANGNRTLGSGAVGGMLVGTLALLFIVPALFILFQYLQEKIRPTQFQQPDEWSIRAEIEDLQNRKEKES